MATKGRKRDINAKRRKTTKAERSPLDRGTEELQDKRKLMSGDAMTSADFPLDVMLARKLITKDEHVAGERFANLAWRLFGSPKGCDAIYQRMVAGGVDDFAQQPSADEDPEVTKRRVNAKRQHERMIARLQPIGSNRRLLNAVQNAAQHLRMPRYLINFSGNRDRASDVREISDLVVALGLLAEDDVRSQKAA